MALDIGRIAYQAYCDKLVTDECDCDLSKWEELGKWEQDAWLAAANAAACAVAEYLDKERKQEEHDRAIDRAEDSAAFE